MEEARKAFEEALGIYQRFAARDPHQYGPRVLHVERLLEGLKGKDKEERK
jgi:hypothetical protein